MANTFSAVMTAYRLAREADPELRAGLLDGAMAMEEQLNNCAAEGYPGIAHDMLTLTAQRDALKAALQLIADGDTMTKRGITWTHGDTVENYQRIARAAIAAADFSSQFPNLSETDARFSEQMLNRATVALGSAKVNAK